ncbi:hypothetical protein CI102_12538 [Trichoderma harzianum]|nr:hypothetical protein CI102_12538 [Trichoderma harzianum]
MYAVLASLAPLCLSSLLSSLGAQSRVTMPCLCLSVSGTTNCGNLWLLPPSSPRRDILGGISLKSGHSIVDDG